MSRSASLDRLNIYDQIAANRWRSGLLIALFVLFVMAVVEVIGLALGAPLPLALIGLAIALSSVGLSYYFSDSLVLGISQARPVQKKDDSELHNLVENLCLGVGLPLPRIYLIDDGAINAFATGRNPQHAALAVTRGARQRLTKLELEGVIAHELSHVRNFDIRTMAITAVLLGMVAIAADLFLRWTWYGAGARSRYRGKGEGAGGAVLLVIAVALAILAPLVARLIQSAVSRQREYLADASGALLTRYPEGLASALEKIAQDNDPLDVATKGTAHLFISDPFLRANRSSLNNLFSTHPDVQDRIRRLRAM
ncbi:MAG: zinc metalloprotease HtpX [Dehalococcoidia bacterium]|nr:zinc metalloprotease HtpX [Dehalococcoidia bacterium]